MGKRARHWEGSKHQDSVHLPSLHSCRRSRKLHGIHDPRSTIPSGPRSNIPIILWWLSLPSCALEHISIWTKNERFACNRIVGNEKTTASSYFMLPITKSRINYHGVIDTESRHGNCTTMCYANSLTTQNACCQIKHGSQLSSWRDTSSTAIALFPERANEWLVCRPFLHGYTVLSEDGMWGTLTFGLISRFWHPISYLQWIDIQRLTATTANVYSRLWTRWKISICFWVIDWFLQYGSIHSCNSDHRIFTGDHHECRNKED